MEPNDKLALRQALKTRKSDAGIFAFGRGSLIWVGQSKTLASAESRLRFTLRTGGLAPASLTAAWAASAGEGFAFEVLEALDPELSPINRDDTLRARATHWRGALGAEKL